MTNVSAPTVEQLIEKLEECVNERGADYVYLTKAGNPPDGGSGCDYVRNGQPSCLIGCAVHKLGVSVEELASHELATAVSLFTRLWPNLRYDSLVVRVAQTAQNKQDNGKTWGEALTTAKEVAARESRGV